MRFTLRQLEVFAAVARLESVTRAAELLALSQSAASTSLTELERQSDCQLFDRVGKRLRLNALGRQLLPQAMALLNQAREIEDLLDGYRIAPAEVLAEAIETPSRDLVAVTGIDFHSVCPHHLLPSRGVAHVAYLPGGRVVGFGQLARLVDCLAHRLVLQEDLARTVAEALAPLAAPAAAENDLVLLNAGSSAGAEDFSARVVETLLRSCPGVKVLASSREGWPNVLLEAMACGTPVITSNTSSLPEVVGDAGIMVDPMDVDALADSMHQVLTDEVLKGKLKAKGISPAGVLTPLNSPVFQFIQPLSLIVSSNRK